MDRISPHRLVRIAAASLFTLITGCAPTSPPPRLLIDDPISAHSQSSRVQFVVLHYTSSHLKRALQLLSRGDVSSHYLITDEEPPRILQLVDENRSAWHAGESAWRGRTWLNASSVGIEIVNPGYTLSNDGEQQWHPYSAAQIKALSVLLRDIVQRHGVRGRDIVGHSDIAPQRKQDPGPLFPWKHLAEQGLGRWFDENAARTKAMEYAAQGLPEIRWFQHQLQRLGYSVPENGILDEATTATLRAFQMHYRASDVRGVPDAETAGILSIME